MGAHLDYKTVVETPGTPGEKTADINVEISNFAAIAYSTDQADLYPGNQLKQDRYYFPKEIAKCNGSNSERATYNGREANTPAFRRVMKPT